MIVSKLIIIKLIRLEFQFNFLATLQSLRNLRFKELLIWIGYWVSEPGLDTLMNYKVRKSPVLVVLVELPQVHLVEYAGDVRVEHKTLDQVTLTYRGGNMKRFNC